MKKKSNIILVILLSLLVINVIVFSFMFNSFTFVNGIIPLIIDTILLATISGSIYFIYKSIFDFLKEKLVTILIVISTILNLIFLTFNISTNLMDKTVSKITSKEEVYASTIIVKADSQINNVNDLNNKKIGISDNENDYENYILGYDYLKKNKKIDSNEFYKYSDYLLAIKDLLEGKIDSLVISDNYITIYNEYYPELNNQVKSVVTNLEYSVKTKELKKKNKEESFTILVIGADQLYGSFNADVLILMTVNPNTKKVVMVDVVRDTYAYNLGNNMMDKITHSGWYGAENVKNTVSKLFGINIDYYIKFNFKGVEELVDKIGGLEVNVPYRYPVTKNGYKYYIEPGVKKLNGLETLMLARTRREAGSNLITRGKMQMEIIEQVTKQADGKFVVNNFLDIFDLLGDNIKTDINKQDIYYYVQKYISIKDKLIFESYTLPGVDSTYYHSGMGLNLYTYKYDEAQLKFLSTKLEENLK